MTYKLNQLEVQSFVTRETGKHVQGGASAFLCVYTQDPRRCPITEATLPQYCA